MDRKYVCRCYNCLSFDQFWCKAVGKIRGRRSQVRHIVNNIHVNRFHKYSDAALKKHIENRLTADWETHGVADRIRVTVKEGVVTLFGDVNTWPEYMEAARAASLVDGVWEVVNQLRVAGVNYPFNPS